MPYRCICIASIRQILFFEYLSFYGLTALIIRIDLYFL